MLRGILLGLVLVFSLGCRAPAQTPTPRGQAPAKGEAAPELTKDEQAIVDFTNAERQAAGLKPLKANAKLMAAARGHAVNMAAQNTLDHKLDGKDMVDRIKAADYKYRSAGENIAFNYDTPKACVQGWMDSPGHKRNILTEGFEEIGVSLAKNKKGEWYWVQVFGSPLK
jgi:uncharacterized protein YkwD